MRAKKQRKKGSPATALVPVDGRLIRERAIKKSLIVGKELERLRKEWQRFEEEDQPEYESWYAREFGRLSSELRRIREKSSELRGIIERVEFIAKKEGVSYPKAWRFLKDHPSWFGAEDYYEIPEGPFGTGSFEYEFEPGEEELDLEEEELRMIFEGMIETMDEFAHLLDDPEEYAVHFARFRTEFARMDEDDSVDFDALFGRPDNAASADRHPIPAAIPTEDEVKRIFRVAARLLHPDTGTCDSDDRTRLWMEAQAARDARDADRLKVIVAMATREGEGFTPAHSVGDIMAVTEEYARHIRTFRTRIEAARTDAAWDFARKESGPLREILERNLKSVLASETAILLSLQGRISIWKEPRRRKTRHDPGSDPAQLELSFT